jgi:hypothetical protein
MSTLPVTVIPSSSVQFPSNEVQQVLKGVASLPDDRKDIFLHLFGIGQPPARDRRLQKFVKEVLPDLVQSEPTVLSRMILAILDSLGRASPDELQLFQEPRIPSVFQWSPAYRPEFHLLRSAGDQIDITFPALTHDLVVLANFVALPQFHVMPGTIFVDGNEVEGATYGEDHLYYKLGSDYNQRLTARAGTRPSDTPVWLIIHYVIARQNFIAELCQRHDIPCAKGTKVLCRHKSCSSEWLELAGVVSAVIQTGNLHCPQCRNNIGWAEIVLQGGMKAAAPHPAPPAPRRTPARAREAQLAILENLEYAQVPVKEESVEEQESRKMLSIILCSRLKGPPEKSNITGLFEREFGFTEERSVDQYREPETTDGFLDVIEAIDPY